MNLRLPSLSLLMLLGTTGLAWGQTSSQDQEQRRMYTFPPNTAPAPQTDPGITESGIEPPTSLPQADDEEKPEPYQYPQRHMFQQPLNVGPDQLRLYNGYWQPGGYQVRDGSPFFNSVPGAPPRGPIAGGGGDSSYNPAAGAGGAAGAALPNNGYQGMPPMNGAAGYAPQHGGYTGYPAPGMYDPYSGYGQAAAQPYGAGYGYQGMQGPMGLGLGQMMGDAFGTGGGMNGMNGVGGAGGAGGSGGPGGDPYNYHFGPGYYRSGEYGHFRFPYYSYRRPWYFPGFAGYNRDTNIPW